MNFFQIVLMTIITLVVLEFGVHVIYHAVTGKGGVNEPAFDYLKDIYNDVSARTGKTYKCSNISIIERPAVD